MPAGFRARPTTDFAREGLFNVLKNHIDLENLRVLDLFGGTGSISLEFASRGAVKVDLVEADPRSCAFLKKTISALGMDAIRVCRSDAFRFIERSAERYDLIFADPPYDLEGIPGIPDRIFNLNILQEEGWFILEHGRKHIFSQHPNFLESRRYGNVHFSIFGWK